MFKEKLQSNRIQSTHCSTNRVCTANVSTIKFGLHPHPGHKISSRYRSVDDVAAVVEVGGGGGGGGGGDAVVSSLAVANNGFLGDGGGIGEVVSNTWLNKRHEKQVAE